MPEKHAKLSASGSKKWLNCPFSIAMENEFPDTESEYAQEGTTAHTLAELKIRRDIGEITRIQYLKRVEDLKMDQEMEQYTEDYKDFVLERFHYAKTLSKDAVLKIEEKIYYSKWAPEGFGTGDAVIIADGVVEIIDLKYGKGVKVNAKENTQMMLYALGAIEEYDYLYNIEKAIMTIYQPRRDHIASFEMSKYDLYQWGEHTVKPIAKQAFEETGHCYAGKHCTEGFCKAIPVCRAFAEYMQEVEKNPYQKPEKLTDEEIEEILYKSKDISKWIKKIEQYVLQQALKGKQFIGFKVVAGKSSRKYSLQDNEIASVLLEKGYKEDQIYKRELRSVTDMQKHLGKEKFQQILGGYVIKTKGSPTLATLEDKRPVYNSAEDDFKNIKL